MYTASTRARTHNKTTNTTNCQIKRKLRCLHTRPTHYSTPPNLLAPPIPGPGHCFRSSQTPANNPSSALTASTFPPLQTRKCRAARPQIRVAPYKSARAPAASRSPYPACPRMPSTAPRPRRVIPWLTLPFKKANAGLGRSSATKLGRSAETACPGASHVTTRSGSSGKRSSWPGARPLGAKGCGARSCRGGHHVASGARLSR